MADDFIPPAIIEIIGRDTDFISTITKDQSILKQFAATETKTNLGADSDPFQTTLTGVKSELLDLAKQLTKARVGADATPFWTDIARLRSEIDAMSPLDINVDARTSTALAQIAALRGGVASAQTGSLVAGALGAAAASGDKGGGGGGGLMSALGFGGLFGLAGFGTVGSLAGFGPESMLMTGAGILGSAAGGLAGGAALGLGSAGVAGVGMGTDLAGIGQAAGDIRNVTQAQSALNQAIAEFGPFSTQAKDAQAQYNYTLSQFSPIAQSAVAAASATAQGFKAQFDQVTGAAEKTGADILNQLMQVGEKFLPTIGKYAAQNMTIIQASLQPLLTWIQGPGLAVFGQLEQTFQNQLPTAMVAFDQGVELLIKTLGFLAPYTGKLIDDLARWMTELNGADFGKFTGAINTAIGIFRDWEGLIKAVGTAIYELFSHDAGTGTSLVVTLTDMVNHFNAWARTVAGGDQLHSLMEAHKNELLAIIGVLGQLISSWGQVELVIRPFLMDLIGWLADVIGWLAKIPGIGQFAGIILAFEVLGSKIGPLNGLLASFNGAIKKLAMDALIALGGALTSLGGPFATVGGWLTGLGTEAPTAAERAAVAMQGAAESIAASMAQISESLAGADTSFAGFAADAEASAASADAAMAGMKVSSSGLILPGGAGAVGAEAAGGGGLLAGLGAGLAGAAPLLAAAPPLGFLAYLMTQSTANTDQPTGAGLAYQNQLNGLMGAKPPSISGTQSQLTSLQDQLNQQIVGLLVQTQAQANATINPGNQAATNALAPQLLAQAGGLGNVEKMGDAGASIKSLADSISRVQGRLGTMTTNLSELSHITGLASPIVQDLANKLGINLAAALSPQDVETMTGYIKQQGGVAAVTGQEWQASSEAIQAAMTLMAAKAHETMPQIPQAAANMVAQTQPQLLDIVAKMKKSGDDSGAGWVAAYLAHLTPAQMASQQMHNAALSPLLPLVQELRVNGDTAAANAIMGFINEKGPAQVASTGMHDAIKNPLAALVNEMAGNGNAAAANLVSNFLAHHKDADTASGAMHDAITGKLLPLVQELTNAGYTSAAGLVQQFIDQETAAAQAAQAFANALTSPVLTALANVNKAAGGIANIVTQDSALLNSLPGASPKKMATGGLVTSPTLALIGEAGPELVIPLSGIPRGLSGGVSPFPTAGYASAGGGAARGDIVVSSTYNVTINADGGNPQQVATAFKKAAQEHTDDLIRRLRAGSISSAGG